MRGGGHGSWLVVHESEMGLVGAPLHPPLDHLVLSSTRRRAHLEQEHSLPFSHTHSIMSTVHPQGARAAVPGALALHTLY
jgi:hypothetical protein